MGGSPSHAVVRIADRVSTSLPIQGSISLRELSSAREQIDPSRMRSRNTLTDDACHAPAGDAQASEAALVKTRLETSNSGASASRRDSRSVRLLESQTLAHFIAVQ
jgi:hypothetical protein